jgi:hypothetical protein
MSKVELNFKEGVLGNPNGRPKGSFLKQPLELCK